MSGGPTLGHLESRRCEARDVDLRDLLPRKDLAQLFKSQKENGSEPVYYQGRARSTAGRFQMTQDPGVGDATLLEDRGAPTTRPLAKFSQTRGPRSGSRDPAAARGCPPRGWRARAARLACAARGDAGVAAVPARRRAFAAGPRGRYPAANARRRCLLYTSPSPRDATLSRMPSSA